MVRTGQRDLMKEHAIYNIDALKDRGAKTALLPAQDASEQLQSTGYGGTKEIYPSRHLMHIKGKDWAFEAPRDVLQSIPGVKFKEMARNRDLQICCGAGGGVKAGIPDLALDMAKARVVKA